MRRFNPPSPYSILQVLWATVSATAAHAITRRRLPAALLTGAFTSISFLLEERVLSSDLYYRLLDVYYDRGGSAEREADERRRQRLLDEYGFDVEPWPLPTLHRLLRVVAVGQERRLEGGTLLVTTLESYAEGGIVFVRLLADEGPEETDDHDDEESRLEMPEPVLSVRDDRGHLYRVGSIYSSDGGEEEYYWEFRLLEPLDPEAGELTLVVAELEWPGAERGVDHPPVRSGQTGPWEFRVSL